MSNEHIENLTIRINRIDEQIARNKQKIANLQEVQKHLLAHRTAYQLKLDAERVIEGTQPYYEESD